MQGDRPSAAWRRIALASLVLLALAARLPTLGLRRVVEGDGVHYAALARDVLAGDLSGLGNPYWSNLWPGTIALLSAATGLPVVEAGRLASLLAGSLLAAATALLGERVCGPAAGLAAGLAVVGHPWLVHFSTLVFTESCFALLLVLLLLAALAALRAPDLGHAAGLGLAGGLAAVTRPEAFAALALSMFVVGRAAARAGGARRAARLVLTVAAITFAFLAVRAAICWRYYGLVDLGIGSKGTANLLLGLAEDDAARERLSNEVTEQGDNRLDDEVRRSSLPGFVLRNPGRVARHFLGSLGKLAASLRNVLPPLPVALGRSAYPATGPPAVALALLAAVIWLAWGVGVVLALRERATRPGAALLLAAIALHLAGLALLNVHDRLVVALAPLAVVFLGNGLARSARHLVPRAPVAALAGALVACGALSSAALLRAPSLAYGDDPVAARDAGLWLRDRFARETRLMTPSPAVAFYFYDAAHKENEVDLPWAPYERVLDLARREGVELLAAPEWYLEAARFPSAPRLVRPDGDHPGLVHLASVGGPAPYRVHLYRVLPEP
jgi:hypothetical protein